MQIENHHQEAAHEILPIVGRYISLKNRDTSLELLSALGTLTGQLALRSNIETGERVLELFNTMRIMCEENDLTEANQDGIKIPAVDFDFLIDVVLGTSSDIEKVFNQFSIQGADKEIVTMCAVVLAIGLAKNEFAEDVSGLLPYVTHTMVAGSKTVIK
ncbi:MAG: hypothetical protein H7235_07200 [Bdellovibrionaceae bacterium]|nr:hypothetical protein [Pseudobdellovibrionaceae bacterium]